MDRAIVAHVFTIWSFRLEVSALIQIAFDHHLRVRGDQNVVCEAFHERRRLAANSRERMIFLALLPIGGSDEIQRMRADREGDRQALILAAQA